MTDLLDKTQEELIEYCKSKDINFLTKAKKPMSKKTIIVNLKKLGLIADSEDNIITETSDIDLIIKISHNYLYKSAGIVGSKAQNDIMRVLIIKIFNILLLKNNSYLLSVINDTNIRYKCLIKQDKLDKYKSFIYDINNLLKEPDIKNSWSNFINDFMAKLFDNIYITEDANFNTPNEYDIKELIKIISKFKITDEFIKDFFMKNGDIHESFLKYQGKVNSKELGQFFTPRIIIKSLLNECGFKDLILNKEENNLSLCDLCMGTGGLLCYTYEYCKDKINPSKIYGCDIERDTVKFGSASLMLATNQYNSNIIRCNSLVENPYLFNKEEDKFDIIIINPPFGTKNKWKDLTELFNNYKAKITTKDGFDSDIELIAEKRFFEDRLIITTSVGVETGANNSETSTTSSAKNTIIGDVRIEYLINEKGTFRVNAFNESNRNTVNQSAGLFSQGAGLNYQEEFNGWNDFQLIQSFLDIFRAKRNKKVKTKRNKRQIKVSDASENKDEPIEKIPVDKQIKGDIKF